MTFENKREHQTITLQALLITLPEASIFVPHLLQAGNKGGGWGQGCGGRGRGGERERLLLAFWPPSFLLLPQIALLSPAGMYILFSLNQMKEAQLLGDRIILGIFGGVCHLGKIPK